jgi:D-sedoheptulose 7-phosphate isomerase
VDAFQTALETDRQIFVCGNGGSAATANHLACDILKGASYERQKRFRITSLSDQLATITAYANDVDYSEVFAEPLANFAKPGDLLVVISGSGNSHNVVRALKRGNELGCYTVALTGRDGGECAQLAQLNVHVTEDHMGRIEDGHMIICHMVAYYFIENAHQQRESPATSSTAPLYPSHLW